MQKTRISSSIPWQINHAGVAERAEGSEFQFFELDEKESGGTEKRNDHVPPHPFIQSASGVINFTSTLYMRCQRRSGKSGTVHEDHDAF